jgi:sugar lactone lactonase YvrE
MKSRLFFFSFVCYALLAAPATSRADNIFVSNSGNNTIEEFNSSGVGTVFASSGLDDPQGLAFDSRGNLYVANQGNNTIEKFNTNGVGSVFASSGLNGPTGLAFDSSGNLYVANSGGNTIEEFNTNGVGSVFTSLALSYPAGLAFDSSGNLYGPSGSGVIKFNTNGVGTGFAGPITDSVGYRGAPTGLAFDSSGNLYVAVTGTINFHSQVIYPASIVVFNTNGGVGTFFASDYSNLTPNGIAFDSSGNLYVANSDNIIEEYDTGGVGSVFANSGLDGPAFIATQIPEPSTSALLAVGALLLWPVLRRKRA